MKHLTPLTRNPASAQQTTIGQIMALIATMMTEISTFLIAKDTAEAEAQAAAIAALSGSSYSLDTSD